MKRDPVILHLIAAFILALVLYYLSFHWIEYRRTRLGGWHFAFLTDSNAIPALEVSHPKLRVTNTTFSFPDQHLANTNLSSLVVFDKPLTNVPFGKIIYFDTTFLPGSVVMELFGHQIQFLPRVLILDRREIQWNSVNAFILTNSIANRGP